MLLLIMLLLLSRAVLTLALALGRFAPILVIVAAFFIFNAIEAVLHLLQSVKHYLHVIVF